MSSSADDELDGFSGDDGWGVEEDDVVGLLIDGELTTGVWVLELGLLTGVDTLGAGVLEVTGSVVELVLPQSALPGTLVEGTGYLSELFLLESLAGLHATTNNNYNKINI